MRKELSQEGIHALVSAAQPGENGEAAAPKKLPSYKAVNIVDIPTVPT